MKLLQSFMVIPILMLCLAGCQDDVPDAELVGTLWTLQSIEVPGEPDIKPEATRVYNIQFFGDNRIEGWIDCNFYGGAYTLTEGDSMLVDIHFITERGCGESDNSIAVQLLGEFRAVYSFGIIGNQLRLYFDNSVLKFRNVE